MQSASQLLDDVTVRRHRTSAPQREPSSAKQMMRVSLACLVAAFAALAASAAYGEPDSRTARPDPPPARSRPDPPPARSRPDPPPARSRPDPPPARSQPDPPVTRADPEPRTPAVRPDPYLRIPPGTRTDAQGQLVSGRGLRDTSDFFAKELARRGIAAQQIGPYGVRGVELTRFLSQTPATPWLAIH